METELSISHSKFTFSSLFLIIIFPVITVQCYAMLEVEAVEIAVH